MKFSNIKIGMKLAIGFGIVLILTMVLVFVGVTGLNRIKDSFERRSLIIKVNDNLVNAHQNELLYRINRDNSSSEKVIIQLANIGRYHEEAVTTFKEPEFLAELDNIQKLAKEYQSTFQEYVAVEQQQTELVVKMDELAGRTTRDILGETDMKADKDNKKKDLLINILQAGIDAKKYLLTGDDKYNEQVNEFFVKASKQANDIRNEKIGDAIKEYQRLLSEYSEKERAQQQTARLLDDSEAKARQAGNNSTEEQATDMYKMITRMNYSFVLLALLTLVLGITFSLLITRTVSRGIRRGVGFATMLAQGKLDADIEPAYLERKDEIGKLAVSLQQMLEKLRDVVESVVSGANNITSASQQLSNSSQLVSQGATEQASSAEEASSAIQQMTANIQQNSENAQVTEKMAAKAAVDLDQSSQNVNNTVNSMKQIAGKVLIINDIAFQTNILALNAAVEAARAGEHGKGFAVVAAEVRKLAERSQVAASEINQLASVSVNEAEKSGAMLQSLVPEIQKTARLIQEISAASMEQNSGVNHINIAIQQLNQVIQQNAASSEEMATSSEELESQASQLHDLISFFKLPFAADFHQHFKRKNGGNKKLKTNWEPGSLSHHAPRSLPYSGHQDNLDKQFERF
ncbi:MAG: HAMP domain-containing methyl-accepting chemotaxis protein [Bacteroidetes bacterium]|nr:HAMP domain-containing methyl-accepting chemotaxis protein [Bacteroidota bacterium]